jgi:hypothetical protein
MRRPERLVSLPQFREFDGEGAGDGTFSCLLRGAPRVLNAETAVGAGHRPGASLWHGRPGHDLVRQCRHAPSRAGSKRLVMAVWTDV